MKIDRRRPLALDVDGTFLKTDLLLEGLCAGMGRHPIRMLRLFMSHFRRPERLKAELAAHVPMRMELMPVNPAVLELAKRVQAEGREVCLASASDRDLVTRLAQTHGLSERVFASDAGINLKGPAKAEALVGAFGENGFDYAGNEVSDVPVWERAYMGYVVGRLPVAVRLRARGKPMVQLSGEWQAGALWKALRPQQWVKNVLLLLPMIVSLHVDAAELMAVVAGMIAFSAAASTIYIGNDLLDLEADRRHPTKFRRPFASGNVPISVGIAMASLLKLTALTIAAILGPAFLGTVLLYIVLSTAYSLRLKRMRWIDVATLAALYTLRVVAGAAAGHVEVSIYMLIFVFPVFVALGCVKRLTELTLARGHARLPGRGYSRVDRRDLLHMAWMNVFGALLIFLLYSISDQGRSLYPHSWALWGAMAPMGLWLGRMVHLGWHGRQDYDPIVFALRDRVGLGLIAVTITLIFWAAGLWQHWWGIG